MGRRNQSVETDYTFVPKINETSKRIALNKRQINTNGNPHFMLETKCKLNTREPLGPIPISDRSNSEDVSHRFENRSVNNLEEADVNNKILTLSVVNPNISSTIPSGHRNQMLIKKCPNFDDIATIDKNGSMSDRELDTSVFTFKPILSNASKKIAETLTSDFMSRQQQHIENQKKHIERADIIYKKSLNLSPRSRRHPGQISKEIDNNTNETENEIENNTETCTTPIEPVSKSEVISEVENLAIEERLDDILEMPAVSPLSVDRMKTMAPTNLQRLLEGPYATSQQVLKNQKSRFSHPSILPRPIGDRMEGDKDNDAPGVFTRSKTMSSIIRPKFGRKLSLMADGERLRNAKETVERAIKYRKVFTIQGGYASIRHSLRKRGWVEKFYRTTGPVKRPSRPKRRKQNSESDDDSDGGDNNNDDDDGTDDDNDEPKIPPWEEDDGIYGIMSRMVRNVNPLFFWVLKRDVIDYRFLLREQMVNHYCKAGSFTTKVGLCVNLRNVRFFDNADQDSFCPRCYRLSHEEDKEAFIDDYRLSACMNIIKIIYNVCVANKELNTEAQSNDKCVIVNINAENNTSVTVKTTESFTNEPSIVDSEVASNENMKNCKPQTTDEESDKCEPIRPTGSCKDPKCTEITKDGTKCVHLEEDEVIIQEEKKKEEMKKLEDSKKVAQLNMSSGGKGTPNHSKASPRGSKKKKRPVIVPVQALELAIAKCENFLRFKQHEDIDQLEEFDVMSDNQWHQLIQWYYNLAHDDGVMLSVPQSLLDKCDSLINRLKNKWLQFDLDGVKNVWIVKPGAKSRGRGIVCYDKLEDMLKLVNSTVVRKDSKYVVQKYIERPLLIYNTKFDIRQWFLVTDWNPLTIWFYQDSYLRFCSQQYTLDDFDESIHLSNNAIQKHYKNGPRSASLPSDNMWTHDQFKDYLRTKNRGNLWDEMIYPEMKKAIQCSLLTAQDLIEYRKSSFELYGADFMLTEDYRPWLIEINSSPSMEASTAVTARMCNNVLDDTIKVVIDRKHDRNCDIGKFELSYRQPVVSVPPYIGINLQIEGQGIRKPFGYKKPEVSQSFDLVSPKSSRTNISEKSPAKSTSSSSNSPSNVDSCSKDSSSTDVRHKKDVAKKSPIHGASAQSNITSFNKQMPKTGTSSVEPSGSDCKIHSSVSDIGISRSQYYTQSDMQQSKLVKSSGASRQPEPPSHPKVCMQTPYVAVGNRRIISKTSVSVNYSIPGMVSDKSLRPAALAVKNVETTDIRHIKAQKGLTQLIPSMWCHMCSECGYGTNLHFHAVNPNCKCRRDRIVDCILNSRPKSAHPKTSHSKLSLGNSRPPSAANSIQKIKEKYSSTIKIGSMDKVLLKYTDGSAKRHHQKKDPLPRVVGYYIKNSHTIPNKKSVRGSVYLDTSKYTNPFYITTHRSNIQ